MIRICNIPQNFRFSFSKLQLFDHCPMAFKLQYLEPGVADNGNAFSDYGTFCHNLLELWAKGELLDFMLPDAYAEGYEKAIKHDFPPFPPGMWEKYRQQGQDYFDDFHGFGDQYEIVSVEQKMSTKLAGFTFSGIADLILRDKNTGDLTVVDHKSKSKKQMEDDLDVYRKQLYIYAHFVMTQYGKFPKKLAFNGFRENYYYEEQFDPVEYAKSLEWVGETIDKILKQPDWNVSSSSFYCRYICSCFDKCPAAESILHLPPKTLVYRGIQKTVVEWAEETGLSKATITRRMNKGMSAEEIFEPQRKKKKSKKNEELNNGNEEEDL